MATITTNEELKNFLTELPTNKTFYAIRTKGKIETFETIRKFNKAAKLLPDAVQGEINANNYVWYKF